MTCGDAALSTVLWSDLSGQSLGAGMARPVTVTPHRSVGLWRSSICPGVELGSSLVLIQCSQPGDVVMTSGQVPASASSAPVLGSRCIPNNSAAHTHAVQGG